MDHNFTKLIGDWLNKTEAMRDFLCQRGQNSARESSAECSQERLREHYSVGALYLLKLSGNKILYTNIVANIDRRHDVIEYQLQKYYNFRVKELTHDEVEAMQRDVDRIADQHQLRVESRESRESNQSSLDSGHSSLDKNHRGKRDDHDLLPDEIKALYVENLSLLQRMRELHLKLRSLSLENVTCPDSERYPFLKEIISLDKKLHSNWERYDHYIPTAPTATADASSACRSAKAENPKAASSKKSTAKKKSDK